MWRASLDSSRAQALVEFSFVAPVLILLIIGMIDFGRGFYYQTQTTDAARDGARLLAGYEPETSSSDTDSNSSTCTEGATCDSDDTYGPGYAAICNEVQRDITNVTFGSPACQQMTNPGPWTVCGTSPCDYSAPATSTALALIYCGWSTDCATPNNGGSVGSGAEATCDTNNTGHTCVTVEVVYNFSFLMPGLNGVGLPSLVLSDTAEMVTLW